MEHPHEIHIVGGGLAGLTAAAFAARAGARVTVHETRHRLGGRATTDERDGFRFDQGPHALYRGGPAERALDELGIRPAGVAPRVAGVVVRDGQVHRAPTGPGSLLSTTALGAGDKAELGRVLATLPRQRPEEHAHRTTDEWVDGVARRRRVREVLHLFSRLTTYANHPAAMSAEVTVQMVQQGTGPGVRYLEGGWEQLVGALARVATGAGARIVAGDPVRQLPDAAAVIVAAGGPAAAAELLGRPVAHGPAAEVACLDLGLRGAPPHSIALGIDEPMYASHHSVAPGRAPAGGSVLAAAEYLAPGVEPDRERLERFVRTIGVTDGSIATERYLHRMVACTAVPLASEGGLAGRPGVAAPDRPGVFLAGDWVGPEGHLADAVFASARAAALAAVDHVARLPVVR